MTERESSLETLRETHTFPCEYEFKVIGDNDGEFVARVVEVGNDVTRTESEPTVDTRESGGGTYVSVTMAYEIHEAETILDVYEAMRELETVQVVL